MDKRLIRYFKIKQRKGKSIVAHILDSIAAYVAAYGVIFILIWSAGARLPAAALYALLCILTAAVILRAVNKARLQRFIAKQTLAAKRQLAFEALLLTANPYDTLKMHMRTDKNTLVIADLKHPEVEFNCEAALNAIRRFYRSGAHSFIIVTAASPTPSAQVLVSEHNGSFDDNCIEAALSEFMPDDIAAQAYLLKKYDNERLTKQKLKEGFISKNKAGAWAAVALMLTFWGIVFGKGAIYFTSAGICGTLSAYCALRGKQA